ncbi:MAG: S46 family peptidase [Myxococcales bacterium]|nr:S46 family peptidase [Myxococcales bacterium]MCB9752454.1 S46 family peptidase [Myxococcales bacterium]
MQRPGLRAVTSLTAPCTALALALALASCASSNADATGPNTPPEGGAATEEQPRFENPGGMWMPGQMAAHADTLKGIGVEFDPAALADPTAFPLGAVVSLGGCSASFVSPEGLIVTNHHCVGSYLQLNSSPDDNLLKNGFLAKTRADEKSGGPRARVYVTTRYTDVTEKVLEGTDKIADDEARYEQIAERRKQLTNACEQGREDMRCYVASFFEGAKFFQIEQIQLRDIRLVYAPDAGIGVFGGDVDNWRWPRHTGDWAFLRAYVGKDGKPADYAADNVPYKPAYHLKVAQERVEEGDFVMVAGYPGRTNRLKTAGEVQEAAEWYYDHRIEFYEEYLGLLESLTKDDEELAIKASGRMRGLGNYLINYKGMRDGLKGGLAAEKQKLEADLRAWIEQDPQRKAKYGDVLDKIAALNAERAATRDADAAAEGILRGSSLLGVALDLTTWAEERKKPDADRRAGYQDKDVKDEEVSLRAMQKTYDPRLDRAVFKMYLARAARLPKEQRPALLTAIVGDATDDAAIEQALDKLYKKTKLGDADARVKLLKSASEASLKKSRDPFVQLAVKLKPQVDARTETAKKFAGAMATLRPKYIAALREFTPGDLAPDANGTLRVTYGTVRGYTPPGGGAPHKPFTTVTEMAAKHTGTEPFDAPKRLLDAVASKSWGPYAHPSVGEVTLDFLADLDITGGNSGSATLNGRGELCGLVFDGNYESIASDWVFMPAVTRSIHVDIRYVLWVMDAVDGADHLLTELGVDPAI